MLLHVLDCRQHLQVPRNMKPLDRFASERHDMVNVVDDTCLFRQAPRFGIEDFDLCPMLGREPSRGAVRDFLPSLVDIFDDLSGISLGPFSMGLAMIFPSG